MKYVFLLFTATLLLGCSGKQSEKPQPTQSANDTLDEQTTEDAPSIIFTALGVEEGYDSDLWIYPKNEQLKKAEDLPEFSTLHVIPAHTEDDGLSRSMMTMYTSNFHLYEPFDKFSGKVVVFYDKEKHHKAITFSASNGKPDGTVQVFTPKGKLLMKREYDKGKWTKSSKAPACSDWTFEAATSNLNIRDMDNGKRTTDGHTRIQLMPGINFDYEVYDAIIDKSTFVRPFKINGKPYTGQLTAHWRIPQGESYMAFDLSFTNGLLDGDIKIYTEFFGLSLHEIFEDGELVETVYVMDPSEMDGVAKPVIYLYPEDTLDVTVSLDFEGTLTHTYPHYASGWKVKAYPDGTLFDSQGQEYYALYWEGENQRPFTLNEGTVVMGENTITFLEAALETLGLNRREANEFIMYWLPRMENNAFNLIHFATTEYEEMAALTITPKPETVIRVMMVFQPLKQSTTLPQQDLEQLKKERKGFTVVEWGGKELNRPNF